MIPLPLVICASSGARTRGGSDAFGNRGCPASIRLENGPLLRALLVRIDDEQFRLYMTVHQIIFDAVTAYRVFFRNWRRFTRPCGRQASPLPELPIQYATLLLAAEKSSDHTGAKHIAYWRKQLAGELSPLEWPNDRPRPPMETHRGAIQRFALSEHLVRILGVLASRRSVGLYDFAGWVRRPAPSLHWPGRYRCGQSHCGRSEAELEPC